MHNFEKFFSNIVSDFKILKKKYVLSQLSSKRFKNTPVFLIFKKETLIQFSYSERLLKERHRKFSVI